METQKTYNTPSLTIYGSVSEITRNSGNISPSDQPHGTDVEDPCCYSPGQAPPK